MLQNYFTDIELVARQSLCQIQQTWRVSVNSSYEPRSGNITIYKQSTITPWAYMISYNLPISYTFLLVGKRCNSMSASFILAYAHQLDTPCLWFRAGFHYGDVIMTTIASQITSFTIVHSTVYSDADKRKNQSSASLAFVRGIRRGPVNSPPKWPVTRKMFPFDDAIICGKHCSRTFHPGAYRANMD